MKKIKITVLTLLVLWCNSAIWAQSSDTTTIPHCATPKPSKAEQEQQFPYGNNTGLITILQQHGYDVPDNYLELTSNQREVIRIANRSKDLSLPSTSNSTSRVAGACDMYYVPLKIWIYRNTAHDNAIEEREVDELIYRTNRIYAINNMPIRVYRKCSVFYVEDPALFDLCLADEATMQTAFTTHKDPNAYNIHIVNTSDQATGRAAFIPSRASYLTATAVRSELAADVNYPDLDKRSFNASLLAHELGHCFGLYHTHDCDNTINSNNDNSHCSTCDQEPVSRTRLQTFLCDPLSSGVKQCEVTGDHLCDTEGTPNLANTGTTRYVRVTGGINCNYQNNAGEDHWQDTWQPQIRNCMAYTPSRCQDEFTLLQTAAMIKEICNKSGVSCTKPNSFPTIIAQDGTTICDVESKTFYVPVASGDYRWDLIRNDGNSFILNPPVAAGQSAPPVVRPNSVRVGLNPGAVNSSIGRLMATSVSCCECVPLTIDIESLARPDLVKVFGPTQITQNPTMLYTYRLNPTIYTRVVWSLPPGWAVLNTGIPIYGVFIGGSSIEVQVPVGAISGWIRAEADCNIAASIFAVVRTQSGALTCIPQSQTIDGDALTTAPPTIDVDVENGGNALRIEVDNSTETYPAKIHKVYDGTLVKEFDVEGISTKNISELPSGLYFARFYIPNCPFNVRFAKF